MRSVAELKVNEPAVIAQVLSNDSVAKYVALGLVPGTSIMVKRHSPLKDAYYLKVGNHYVGIREDEAKLIAVEDLSSRDLSADR